MGIAVVGVNGVVGKVCADELTVQGLEVVGLGRVDAIPIDSDAVILAAPVSVCDFDGLIVDCGGKLERAVLSLPSVLEKKCKRIRIPNCMASLIAQALAPLHKQCSVTSIIATCMQSVSGAGHRGVSALKNYNTADLFHGNLVNNVLPHEKAEEEEEEIKNDLHELFGCKVAATSFRVPVFVGHIASLRIETETQIDELLLPSVNIFDPRSIENRREVVIGRVRIQKNTADLVICGDQLLCGTAIPAVASIVSA